MEPVRHHSIEPQQEQAIRDELGADERLLLLTPLGKPLLHTSFLFIFAVIWLSFSGTIFVVMLRKTLDKGAADFITPGVIMPGLFVLIGIVVLCAAFYFYRRFKKTVVALTDRRLIAATTGRMRAITLDGINIVILQEYQDRSGCFAIESDEAVFNDILGFYASTNPRYMTCRFPDIRQIEFLVRSVCLPAREVRQPDIRITANMDSIPYSMKTVIESCMDDKEQLFWVEQPVSPGLPRQFMFGSIVCLVLIGMLSPVLFGSGGGSPVLLAVIAVVLVCIFLAFLYPVRKWRNLCYVMTNKRAMIVRLFPSGKSQVESYLANRLTWFGQKMRRNGAGDLIFHECVIYTKNGSHIRPEGFLRLRNMALAKQIFTALCSAYQNRHDDE